LKSKRKNLRRRSVWLGVAMTAPALALLATFIIWPIFTAIEYSMTSASGYGDMDPVGFENYSKALSDERLYAAFARNIVYAITVVVSSVSLGFFLSYLLFIKVKGWRQLQLLLLVPYIMPGVVIALLWKFILEPENGLMNSALRDLGLGSLAGTWLTAEATALPSVSFITAWATIPFAMLLIFGSMLTIPEEIIEAAELDGAGHFSRMVRVVLPIIWPAVALVIFVITVNLFRSFDLVFLLTKGGPIGSTTIATLYVFVQGFVNNSYGYANALGLVIAVVLVIFALIPQLISRQLKRRASLQNATGREG
jgi:raffinose/stachyose/melibiose transport system permease protein